jgi:hypothetical protein
VSTGIAAHFAACPLFSFVFLLTPACVFRWRLGGQHETKLNWDPEQKADAGKSDLVALHVHTADKARHGWVLATDLECYLGEVELVYWANVSGRGEFVRLVLEHLRIPYKVEESCQQNKCLNCLQIGLSRRQSRESAAAAESSGL